MIMHINVRVYGRLDLYRSYLTVCLLSISICVMYVTLQLLSGKLFGVRAALYIAVVCNVNLLMYF